MPGYTIKINGKEYSVSVTETTKGSVQPATPAPVVSKPVAQEKPSAPVNVGNGTKILAPMPGTVLKIKADGVNVKKGDAILVLEAMKMENEIASPADGAVKVLVGEGAKVNSGDVLAVLNG